MSTTNTKSPSEFNLVNSGCTTHPNADIAAELEMLNDLTAFKSASDGIEAFAIVIVLPEAAAIEAEKVWLKLTSL